MTHHTIREVLSTIACERIGLDPDTVLWRDCPTCDGCGLDLDFCTDCGDEYEDPCARHKANFDSPCPNCNGAGRIEVNRVAVVPVCVCGDPATLGTVHRTDGPCWTPVDGGSSEMRALRIGRLALYYSSLAAGEQP